MATPGVDVRATGLLGLVSATATTLVIDTPVSVWGYTIYNATGATQTAGVSNATNTMFTFPFAVGATTVETFGYELDKVYGKVDHTNMSIIFYYSAGQQ